MLRGISPVLLPAMKRLLVLVQLGAAGVAFAADPVGCPDIIVEAPRAVGGPVVKAADFGFSEKSDKNAAAVARALDECRRVKASRLELAPGTYRCFDEPGIAVRDFVDFTVLVFRRAPEYRCQPQSELILDKGNFLVQRCVRTQVGNFTMDWDWENDPLAAFVRVVDRHEDAAHPENAYVDLAFVDYERHPKYPEPVPVQKLMAMDECRTRFRKGPGFSFGQTEGHFGARNAWVKPNVLRLWPGFPMEGRNQNPATGFRASSAQNLRRVRQFESGGLYRLQHCYYGKNGFNFDSNRHFTFRDITVWSCFGMAFVTDGTQKYWQFENVKVVPPTKSEFAAAYPGERFFERPVRLGRPPRRPLVRLVQVPELHVVAQQRRLVELPRPVHDRHPRRRQGAAGHQPARRGVLPRGGGDDVRAAQSRLLADGGVREARAQAG